MITGRQGRGNESDKTFYATRDARARRGSIFGHGSARTALVHAVRGSASRLAGVERQRELAEQRLKRPAGGEVNANVASRLANAGADFEELGA